MNSRFSDSAQIGTVASFSELVATDFVGVRNALCWNRKLEGDFKEVVSQLQLQEDITEVSVEDLMALELSEQGLVARAFILNDLQLLTDFGAAPVLNLLKCYERDAAFDFISTDVYSFHVDRSPVATDTFLCTYHGVASDLIANDEARQNILIPEIREQLLALHDGPESEFEAFLTEHYFDLHYQALPNATPIDCGVGHLWRLAVDHPTQQVPPCIHRAPVEVAGEFRLLLIC